MNKNESEAIILLSVVGILKQVRNWIIIGVFVNSHSLTNDTCKHIYDTYLHIMYVNII